VREERGRERRDGRRERKVEEGQRRGKEEECGSLWFKHGSSVVHCRESLEKKLANSILSENGTSVHAHMDYSVTTLTTTATMQVYLVLCKWNLLALTQQQLKH